MSLYWIWLATLKGLSLHKKQQLLQQIPDPKTLWETAPEALPEDAAKALGQKDLSRALEICRACELQGIRTVGYGEPGYPPRLRTIEDPPMVLYYKGTLPDWKARPLIGVVGTRKASGYGIRITGQLTAQMVVCGAAVVSGAAAGVDRYAMEEVMALGMPVVGVLGCGVDVVYPTENRELFRQTEEKGCLISEYPPGSRPFPGNFLRRNRIISGISDGVLVVEAPEKSGALSTARHAFSQGRDVFAVPGNLDAETCAGSNGLLQEGAYPVLQGWDVVKHYAPLFPRTVKYHPLSPLPPREQAGSEEAKPSRIPEKKKGKRRPPSQISIDNREKSTYSVINKRQISLSDREQAVYDLVGDRPVMPDSILERTELPSGTVQSILTRLVIKGLVQNHPDGSVSRK